MIKILVVILKKQIYIFEKKRSNRSELIPMFGEEAVPFDLNHSQVIFQKVKTEITDIYNYRTFDSFNVDVVYEQLTSTSIKNLVDEWTPCNELQLFSIKRILPQLLYNSKKLKGYDSQVVVQFNGENYTIRIDKNNEVQIHTTYETPQLTIKVNDLPRYLNLLV
ncbi:hypothetical protein [Halalkalibacter wakoensis]|nr:hypothetical protein [Halalkalibacter wakoensis]